MSKRRRNASYSEPDSLVGGRELGERLRWLWLGGVTALLVATPLIPSEAAPAGLGVALLMAWLVLAAGFFVTGAMGHALRLRFGATEMALTIFVAWHTLSALVMADEGQPRQTLNMLWQWVGFGVAFVVMRQVVCTPQESRALVSVMLALAVCLSMHGYYQYFYSMPEARRAYEADREGMLARAGIVAPEGSVDREQFENRLNSTEPLATFTLANSFAGFLAPWLLVSLGCTVLNWSERELHRSWAVTAAGTTVLMAGCFVLTKSRSATLAVLFGIALLVIYGRQRGWRPGWKSLVAACAAVAAMVTGAVWVGGLDLLVLTESSKSLLYRVQYWRATAAMIAEAPWFGCGPGNFQQAYTKYKLPEASETIADPHNFLLEIWATAGTPAMLALVSIFVCFGLQLRGGLRSTAAPSTRGAGEESSCVRAVYWGALAGLPVGFLAGLMVGYVPDFALLVVGTPVAAVVTIGWHGWVLHGRLPIVVLIAGASALLVNLLAAGGISFAGVALTLWLLLAAALNQSDWDRPPRTISPRLAAALATAAVLAALLFWYSTFTPVLNVNTRLAQAQQWQSQGEFAEAERTLLDAIAADSYSVEPWTTLAQFRLSRWLDHADPVAEAPFAEAARGMLARQPRSSAAHQAYGDWYLRAYRVTGDKSLLEEAILGYRRAVELYPNYNFGHAQLAWTLYVGGYFSEAQAEAEQALRLDALNPHREQKLGERRVFDVLPQSQSLDARAMNAEQLMQLVRSTPTR